MLEVVMEYYLVGLIVVLYVITTIFKEGSRYEKYNFK